MYIKSLGCGLLLLLAGQAQAAWQFVPEDSQATAKVTDITDQGSQVHTHRLSNLEGHISDSGELVIPITLKQLDVVQNLGTLPPWLSDIGKKRLATVATQIDTAWLNSLNVGQSAQHTIALSQEEQRYTQTDHVALTITRTGANRFHVQTTSPVPIDTQAVMQEPNAQTVVSLLGYRQLGNTVPLSLDATLIQQ